jgi:acyl-coenzyme A thioesterase PaaI-like protein
MGATVVQGLSIQERLYPQLTCFGCGHANARGLKLRSYPGDGVVTAAFEPWPEHDNGFGFLNGGIIATVLDCHSGAAVFHRASLLGMEPEQGAPLLYVTAGLDLRYLRPVPLDQVLELRAAVVSADDDQVTVEAQLVWDAKPRAAATTRWKRWRPR